MDNFFLIRERRYGSITTSPTSVNFKHDTAKVVIVFNQCGIGVMRKILFCYVKQAKD